MAAFNAAGGRSLARTVLVGKQPDYSLDVGVTSIDETMDISGGGVPPGPVEPRGVELNRFAVIGVERPQ